MKEWLENYWYHYKWHTIVAIFLVIVIVFTISSVVDKKSYSGNVMFVGKTFIPVTQLEDIKQAFKKVIPDGDELNYSQLHYDPEDPDDYQANEMAKESLTSMVVQPYYIYVMSESVYKLYKDSGVFEKLENIFTSIPKSAIDEYAIRLRDTKFAQTNAGIDSLDEDMVILLKVVPYSISQRTMREENKMYEYHKQIFINIVEFK